MENLEEPEIILRTEAVNEILSAPPKWIVRWGISVVFLLIGIALILSSLIRYPDTLTSTATLTTLNPAITIVAKSSGKINQLLVANNQTIKKGSVLAVLENTANYNDVLLLDSTTDAISNKINLTDSLPLINELTNTLNVGSITSIYLQFLKSYKDYRIFIETNLQYREIAILNKELAEYSILFKKYDVQLNLS